MTRFHVYASAHDDPDEGGLYEHSKTFEMKANMLDHVSALLSDGRAV